ncbi:MAG: MarR family winged helix-turn-helix transcriptional regulator [Clostridiales bacterium]|nr:MarR family winged helix-turn-helix transcriptional regulator [Clostridiales bacterium]
MEEIDAEVLDSLETRKKISLMIKNVHLMYEKNLNNKMSEDNMTVSQSMILFYLYKNSGGVLNPVDLERHFGLSRPTITGILKRLEAKGFICSSENPKDRRYKQIRLTDDGLGCLRTVEGTLRKMNEALCFGFSDEETEVICGFLCRMIENLNGCRETNL